MASQPAHTASLGTFPPLSFIHFNIFTLLASMIESIDAMYVSFI